MTLKIGDKVRALTHPREAVSGSPPQQPGANGAVCGIGRVCGDDDPNLLRVRHDDGGEPWYYACDLISIREGAAAAGKDLLEQRLTTLEQRHEAFCEEMASELHVLNQRLTALEPAEQPTGDPVANPAALAQAWERLTQVQRDELQRWMMTEKPDYLPPYAHRLAAESALVAVPGLVAEIALLRAQRDRPPVSVLQAYEGLHREAARWGAWRIGRLETRGIRLAGPEKPLHDALQTLAELGVTPGEPYPARDPEPDGAPAHAAIIHLAAITARLRAIVPWDAAGHCAEELLDEIEGPAKLVLLLLESTTPEQLTGVAAALRTLSHGVDGGAPAVLVADLLEHLAGEGS